MRSHSFRAEHGAGAREPRRTPRARGRAAPPGRRAASATRWRAARPSARPATSRARERRRHQRDGDQQVRQVHRAPPALQHGEAEVHRLHGERRRRPMAMSSGLHRRAAGEQEVGESSTQPASPTRSCRKTATSVIGDQKASTKAATKNMIAAPYMMRTAGLRRRHQRGFAAAVAGRDHRHAELEARRAREHDGDQLERTSGRRRTTRRSRCSRPA